MSERPPLLERLKRRAGELRIQTYALYLAYGDRRTPWYAKLWAGLVVAYTLSPIDLIPDFIPILGYLDDLILVPAGIALALKMIPASVMEEARQKAQLALERAEGQAAVTGGNLRRRGVIIILLIWLLVLVFVIALILRIRYVNNNSVK